MRDVLFFYGCGVVVFIGGFLGVALPLDYMACRSNAQAQSLEYEWGFWTDCLVRDGNRFVPYRTYQQAYVYRHQSVRIEQTAASRNH